MGTFSVKRKNKKQKQKNVKLRNAKCSLLDVKIKMGTLSVKNKINKKLNIIIFYI